ncbi:MAG TPA: rhodanese-like domain-containing protein [Methanoregulaceae archaeon]|nr:rhodanese-like domain-containing protein [Methanoregulaceae archaeon]HQJ87496.1 rhodanese-like domain-containing protein [Methanoregulaceae archaeon]
MTGEQQCRDASPEECWRAINEGGCRIVDVRTPAEFLEGHLADAVNIDFFAPDFRTRIAALDPGGSFVVYCRRGIRGHKAMEMMREVGFRRVMNIAGGFESWCRSGLPVRR